MEFEWDERKRLLVLERRGIDFADAVIIFDGPVLTRIDERHYPETRFVSLGIVETECFVVVHTQRGNVTRVITAWKGGRRERELYEARFPGRA